MRAALLVCSARVLFNGQMMMSDKCLFFLPRTAASTLSSKVERAQGYISPSIFAAPRLFSRGILLACSRYSFIRSQHAHLSISRPSSQDSSRSTSNHLRGAGTRGSTFLATRLLRLLSSSARTRRRGARDCYFMLILAPRRRNDRECELYRLNHSIPFLRFRFRPSSSRSSSLIPIHGTHVHRRPSRLRGSLLRGAADCVPCSLCSSIPTLPEGTSQTR